MIFATGLYTMDGKCAQRGSRIVTGVSFGTSVKKMCEGQRRIRYEKSDRLYLGSLFRDRLPALWSGMECDGAGVPVCGIPGLGTFGIPAYCPDAWKRDGDPDYFGDIFIRHCIVVIRGGAVYQRERHITGGIFPQKNTRPASVSVCLSYSPYHTVLFYTGRGFTQNKVCYSCCSGRHCAFCTGSEYESRAFPGSVGDIVVDPVDPRQKKIERVILTKVYDSFVSIFSYRRPTRNHKGA